MKEEREEYLQGGEVMNLSMNKLKTGKSCLPENENSEPVDKE